MAPFGGDGTPARCASCGRPEPGLNPQAPARPPPPPCSMKVGTPETNPSPEPSPSTNDVSADDGKAWWPTDVQVVPNNVGEPRRPPPALPRCRPSPEAAQLRPALVPAHLRCWNARWCAAASTSKSGASRPAARLTCAPPPRPHPAPAPPSPHPRADGVYVFAESRAAPSQVPIIQQNLAAVSNSGALCANLSDSGGGRWGGGARPAASRSALSAAQNGRRQMQRALPGCTAAYPRSLPAATRLRNAPLPSPAAARPRHAAPPIPHPTQCPAPPPRSTSTGRGR